MKDHRKRLEKLEVNLKGWYASCLSSRASEEVGGEVEERRGKNKVRGESEGLEPRKK